MQIKYQPDGIFLGWNSRVENSSPNDDDQLDSWVIEGDDRQGYEKPTNSSDPKIAFFTDIKDIRSFVHSPIRKCEFYYQPVNFT